eukprot:gene31120-40469_t
MLIIKVKFVSTTQACLFGSYTAYSTTIPTNFYADTSVELGLQFYSDVDGYVTGVRFYKSSSQTGTFTGSLWSTAGALISTANFATLTSSGWQTVNFPSVKKINAMTPYIVSFHSATGFYLDLNIFTLANGSARSLNNYPLHATQSFYVYGTAVAFPVSTHGSQYWVDVLFKANCTTNIPTIAPTTKPTVIPTKSPTVLPSRPPSLCPTLSPSKIPSISPTISPTQIPTVPSVAPTVSPTVKPTQRPTSQPSMQPSFKPTKQPTTQPSSQSSAQPTW